GNGWDKGQIYKLNFNTNASADARVILFDATQHYAFLKVVFMQPFQGDIRNIAALNLFGEVGLSADGEHFIYPVTDRRALAGALEGRRFFGEVTSGAAPGYTGWAPAAEVVRDAQKDNASTTAAPPTIMLIDQDADELYVAAFTTNQATGSVDYDSDAKLNIFASIPNAMKIAVWYDGAGGNETDIWVSEGNGGSRIFHYEYDDGTPAITAHTTPSSSTIPLVDHAAGIATDGADVWMATVEEDGAAGAIRLRKFNKDTLVEDGGATIDVVTGANIPATGEKDWPLAIKDGFLYFFQTFEAPYWRKYNAATKALVASRAASVEDRNGNKLPVVEARGLAAGDHFIYCLFKTTATVLSPWSYVMARFTTDFGSVNWIGIDASGGKEWYGLGFEQGLDHILLSGEATGPTANFERRRNFAVSSALSLDIHWPLVDTAVRHISYSFDAFSFSGVEDGVEIRNLWAFNDPRGISFGAGGESYSLISIDDGPKNEIGQPERVIVSYDGSLTPWVPESLTAISRPTVLSETHAVAAGGNSFQLVDRYGRPARYILNSTADALGRLGDTSFDPGASAVMATELAWNQTLSGSGEFKMNYETGVVEAFDTLVSEDVSFMAPNFPSFAIEFAGLNNKFVNFEGTAESPFVKLGQSGGSGGETPPERRSVGTVKPSRTRIEDLIERSGNTFYTLFDRSGRIIESNHRASDADAIPPPNHERFRQLDSEEHEFYLGDVIPPDDSIISGFIDPNTKVLRVGLLRIFSQTGRKLSTFTDIPLDRLFRPIEPESPPVPKGSGAGAPAASTINIRTNLSYFNGMYCVVGRIIVSVRFVTSEHVLHVVNYFDVKSGFEKLGVDSVVVSAGSNNVSLDNVKAVLISERHLDQVGIVLLQEAGRFGALVARNLSTKYPDQTKVVAGFAAKQLDFLAVNNAIETRALDNAQIDLSVVQDRARHPETTRAFGRDIIR
ncbi:MAG: hypothetical protein ACXABY_21385, partial [Candidatus Thorarchaeota archaeon]